MRNRLFKNPDAMTVSFPTYDQWLLFFVGATTVILTANLIHWITRRERIYALYSAYIFIWVGFFLSQGLSSQWVHFLASIVLQLFAILFYELTILFLNLKDHPQKMRIFHNGQRVMAFFCICEIPFYFFSSVWQHPWHEHYILVGRVSAQSLMIYAVIVYVQHPNRMASFFMAGTAFMLVMQAIGMYLLIRYGEASNAFDLPFNTRFLLQAGILVDMACVSLGLNYRQRQETIRQVLLEQELTHEREKNIRQQLETDLRLQRLKQEKTDMQMRALQSQVNPHFLFNSLNSLSSLIYENPIQATTYVDELSTVYRYLLRSGHQDLISLQSELEFIQSYYHLLKTRHGEGLELVIDVADLYREHQLPPLVLQLLVENAVKHNVILSEQPLTIRIGITMNKWLLVENNIQRRKLRVESNGIGLSNITDKYQLMNYPPPRIEENDGWFRVSLLLLSNLPSAHLIENKSSA
jgi:sensor histidine kinase YesM